MSTQLPHNPAPQSVTVHALLMLQQRHQEQLHEQMQHQQKLIDLLLKKEESNSQHQVVKPRNKTFHTDRDFEAVPAITWRSSPSISSTSAEPSRNANQVMSFLSQFFRPQ